MYVMHVIFYIICMLFFYAMYVILYVMYVCSGLLGCFYLILFLVKRIEHFNHLDMRYMTYFDLGPSASQSSDGGASAAFRILVDSSLHCCLFWAMHLRCSRSSLVVSCSVFSCSLDRSLLRTTGSVVKGRPRNFFPCVAK